MKLQKIDTAAHDLKQYTFRINEKELEALFVSLEVARNAVPKNAVSPTLRDLNKKINNAKKELQKSLSAAKIDI